MTKVILNPEFVKIYASFVITKIYESFSKEVGLYFAILDSVNSS